MVATDSNHGFQGCVGDPLRHVLTFVMPKIGSIEAQICEEVGGRISFASYSGILISFIAGNLFILLFASKEFSP